jgi:type IV pilus assembly protein PilQ
MENKVNIKKYSDINFKKTRLTSLLLGMSFLFSTSTFAQTSSATDSANSASSSTPASTTTVSTPVTAKPKPATNIKKKKKKRTVATAIATPAALTAVSTAPGATPVVLDASLTETNTDLSALAQADSTMIPSQINQAFADFQEGPILSLNNPTNNSTSNQYTGQKISLNFQSIPVRDVLQILAGFVHKNVIISDAIEGNMTLTLKDVPWDQVLAFVLKSQGLAKRETNNILIIAPSKELLAQEQAELTANQALDTLAPLYTESFSINYGKADDYYALLQDPKQTLLSTRGHVVKLNNSNTLIVEDTAKKLASIRELFAKMDHPVKQVLIEARIVYVSTNYQRNLGINWGTSIPGKIPGTPGSLPVPNNGFNMALPVSAIGGAGPGILQLGTVIGGLDLSLQIQAIEAEGGGELVSSPRILTSNNVAGDIQQGQQIPYSTQAASGGTTVQYIPAVLELQVTPQITPNNKLLLNLVITQNQAGKADAAGGAPPINTRKLTTMIMVNNEQTIVLGGVYDRTKTTSVVGLPWLSKIPLIGALFKSKATVDNKDELLIFLTPKIIDVDDKGAEFDT